MKKNEKTLRKDYLIKQADNNELLIPLVEQIIYLEEELKKLEKLPKIDINPLDNRKQRETVAAKMYRDYLNIYTSTVIDFSNKLCNKDVDEIESPLRKWLNRKNSEDDI